MLLQKKSTLHNVCLSVGRSVQKKIVRILKMSHFQVNVVFFYFLLNSPPLPPLKQTRNNFDRQWGGGGLYFNYTPAPLRASFPIDLM